MVLKLFLREYFFFFYVKFLIERDNILVRIIIQQSEKLKVKSYVIEKTIIQYNDIRENIR